MNTPGLVLSVGVLLLHASQHTTPFSMSPRPPAVHALAAGANLQAALDSAVPGDTIELPAGATFTGNFVLPLKAGSSYITIRTANTDELPKAGERIAPEHSGRLARIQSPNGLPAMRTAAGAHHWAL